MLEILEKAEEIRRGREEKTSATYLECVARVAADDDTLRPGDLLNVLEANDVSFEAFKADVERQRNRNAAERIVAGKPDWQAALTDAEAERDEISRRHSAERGEMAARHDAENAEVTTTIDAAKMELQKIQVAEKLLRDTEGISALDPHPVKPEFGTIVRVDLIHNAVEIIAEAGWPRTYSLNGRDLDGLPLSRELEGRRVRIERYVNAGLQSLRIVGATQPAEAA